MKLCSVCNMVLKFEHFSKSKTGHLGYQASCKSCSQIRRKAYNDKRMMSKEGHIRNILTKIKSRAKLKNLAFDLDFEYLTNYSFKLDLKILWLTLMKVAQRDNIAH